MATEVPKLPLRCRCRRRAVTSLRCARCNVPICPDCMVSAPVGFLCRECGSGRQMPLFQPGAANLIRGYAVCLLVATLGGWFLVRVGLAFGFFGLWLSFLFGLGIGELALRVTGRKRGRAMEIMAGVTTGAGLLLAGLPGSLSAFSLLFLLHVAIACFSAVSRIRNF